MHHWTKCIFHNWVTREVAVSQDSLSNLQLYKLYQKKLLSCLQALYNCHVLISVGSCNNKNLLLFYILSKSFVVMMKVSDKTDTYTDTVHLTYTKKKKKKKVATLKQHVHTLMARTECLWHHQVWVCMSRSMYRWAKKGLPSFSGRLASNAGASRMQCGPYQRLAESLHPIGGPASWHGEKWVRYSHVCVTI